MVNAPSARREVAAVTWKDSKTLSIMRKLQITPLTMQQNDLKTA